MMDFLKSLITDFDPMSLFPDLDVVFGWLDLLMRFSVLIGPLCLLGFGLLYLLAPAKEANYTHGYRFYWGMSSVEVWQFTQRLAGFVWTGTGAVMTVVMAIICNGYRDLPRDEMVLSAIRALGWELGIIIATILAINITVIVLFDHKGYRRSTKK